MIQRRNDAEIDVHRLELRDRLIGNIQRQRADGHFPREVRRRLPFQTASRFNAHQKAAGSGFHISLHTGHLPGKGDTGLLFQTVVAIQQPGRIQKGIAVHHAVPQEFRVVQSGDHGEHPPLLREFQMGLEAHQIVDRPLGVVPPQLHHGVGPASRPGIVQPAGFHGAVQQGIMSPAGHDLHRHTALKHHIVLETVDLRLLCVGQLLPKGVVLFLIHRAVYIIIRSLVIPGSHPRIVHVHALGGHQRRRRVEEMEITVLPQQGLELFRQRVGGQGAGGDDDLPCRDLRYLAGDHGDVGMAANLLRDQPGKAVTIHRQRTASLHAGGVGTLEDQAVQPPQFLFQKPHGVFQSRSPQGIGAAQLRKVFRCMGGGHLLRLHFVKLHLNSPLGQLPGTFAAGKSRPDDCYVHAQCPLSVCCRKGVILPLPQLFSLSFWRRSFLPSQPPSFSRWTSSLPLF